MPFLRVGGMALYPFILVNKRGAITDKILINHEIIHLKQQAELLVIPFYILYLLNYLCNLFIYRQHNKAYLNIVFEQEAYHNENNLVYMDKRGLWAWRNYLKNK